MKLNLFLILITSLSRIAEAQSFAAYSGTYVESLCEIQTDNTCRNVEEKTGSIKRDHIGNELRLFNLRTGQSDIQVPMGRFWDNSIGQEITLDRTANQFWKSSGRSGPVKPHHVPPADRTATNRVANLDCDEAPTWAGSPKGERIKTGAICVNALYDIPLAITITQQLGDKRFRMSYTIKSITVPDPSVTSVKAPLDGLKEIRGPRSLNPVCPNCQK